MPTPSRSPDVDAQVAETAPALRAWHLTVNALAFVVLYTATGQAAARAGVTATVALRWDAQVPFVPWMLVPYMATTPLLVMAFLGAREPRELRALSQRCLMATVLAALVFAVWPARVTHEPPLPTSALPALLLQMVQRVDTPYNQWPSLHVVYCLILWPALRRRCTSSLASVVCAAALLAIASSALLTWQHHIVDVITGALLGVLVLRVTPVEEPARSVALHHALLAGAAFTLFVVGWPLVQGRGVAATALVLLTWCMVSSALVALAYLREDAGFLHKQCGRFPWWVWLAYGPYLAGYRVTWWLVGMRDRVAATAVAPRLLVGRRLRGSETALLPPDCRVIDLAAELSQLPALRARTVHTEPLLDLVPVPADRMASLVALIERHRADGAPVFVHCAMGLQRSHAVVAAWRAHHAEAAG